MSETEQASIAPPSWLVDPRSLEEWNRVASEVPKERLGILATYCALHGRIVAFLLDDPKAAARAASLIGQYRALAAALFGAGGSKRPQPGKNPFAQLRDRKARRVGETLTGKPVRYCDGVKTSGPFKGRGCNAWATRRHGRKDYCDAHFAKVVAAIIDRGNVVAPAPKNYAAPVTPGPRPRAKTKGRKQKVKR